MATRDLKNNVNTVQSIAPGTYTTTQTGASADLAGYESATIEFNIGLWTEGTFTPTVEESADDATFTTVAAADLIGTPPTVNDSSSDDNTITLVGYRGAKRYLRVVITVGGGSPDDTCAYAVTIWRGHPRHAPTD